MAVHKMWKIVSIVEKDLKVEFRQKGVINTVLLFSLLVMLMVYFSIDHDPATLNTFGPPAFWISLLFASFLGLSHTMQMETEQAGLTGITSSPLAPWKVYTAKVCSVAVLLVIVELVLVPVFLMMFEYGVTMELGWFLLVVLLGNIGIASLGTLFSSLLMLGRASEFLLPVLMLPLLFPFLIAGVQASAPLLSATVDLFQRPGSPLKHAENWIIFLVAMDLIFFPAGSLLSETLFR